MTSRATLQKSIVNSFLNDSEQKTLSVHKSTLTETISTPLTELFGISHPILLAGMCVGLGKVFDDYMHE